MFDMGGSESFSPSEDISGVGNVSEQASEQARERFAASQAAAKAQQKDEKKSKKRDDNVAQVILQFLTDTQKTHLATLIARLVSRDCPSTFILSVLALINDKCRIAVDEYLQEKGVDTSAATSDQSLVETQKTLSAEANERLAAWIVRMDKVMQVDHEAILTALMLDEQNIDGTILQLTTFVLQEFLTEQEKNASFENLQSLTVSILHPLFQPYMHARLEREAVNNETEVE